MNTNSSNKRLGLFFLGLIVLLFGGVIVAVNFNNFSYWASGFLMCVVGTWLMRISKTQGLSRSRRTYDENASATKIQRPGRLAWILALALLLAAGVSLVFLWLDSQNGGRWTWPVYAVAGSGLACGVVWGYIFMRMGWFID